jgi:two-component system, OmpR family, heavy metal sensor histidine kinase CusS
MEGEEVPQVSEALLEEATERERARAIAIAATVRLGGAFAFLLLSILARGRTRPEWAVYTPMLAGYAALSLILFWLRHRPLSPRVGWLLGLVDVGAVYLIQHEALPYATSPAAMASFTVGPFAAVVALSALTLRTLAIVGAAAAATVAEVLLMRQAHLPFATMVAAAIIMTVMAVVSQAVLRRLRFLVVDLSRAEVKRHLEQRRRSETDAAKQTIERMLAEAQAGNERLGRLQREKESLVQLIVHDLRSPLNAVMLSLEFVAQEVKRRHAGGDLSEALEDARSTAGRVSGMVSQILDTAKLEEGRLLLERSSIIAGDLLRRVRHQLAPMARDKAVEVRVEAANDLMLRGDPRLFGRVIENLLSNSIRHAPSGGQILLAAVREGTTCRLSVHNNGVSIDVGDRERIFAKFQQGGDGARLGGWGLGLYFCRMVVEAHDGTIAVEDTDGWPTSFIMRVPAEASSASIVPAAQAS